MYDEDLGIAEPSNSSDTALYLSQTETTNRNIPKQLITAAY